MVPPRKISKYKRVVITGVVLVFGNITILRAMERLGQNTGIGLQDLVSLLEREHGGGVPRRFEYDRMSDEIEENVMRRVAGMLRQVPAQVPAQDANININNHAPAVNNNNRTMLQRMRDSSLFYDISRGWHRAIVDMSSQTFSEMLKAIPNGMKNLTAFLAAYAYKLSFGTRGLTWNGLAKINNRLYTLFLPLTGAAAQTRDRQRRADLIGAEQTGVTLTEHNWQVFQGYLLRELQHAQKYILQALPCYDLTFLNAAPHGLKIKLARFIQACSLQDSKQVSFYSVQALDCLAQLTKLIQEFKSLDQAQQNHEQIKRWLSLTCNTFEQIALILEGENTQRQPGRLVFSRLSAQSQATMPALDALLSGVGGLPGAPTN